MGGWSCVHAQNAATLCLKCFPQSDHHAVLKSYLLSCVERADWHGVSDAANDLRVLEAVMEATR